MERSAWLLRVRKRKEHDYRSHHAAVWLALIEAARICCHTCFIAGQHVISYAEAEDLRSTFQVLMASEVKKDWDRLRLISTIVESRESPAFEEVFHFD
jgi:L-rhamnose mutarotase